jgi:ComF family protein
LCGHCIARAPAFDATLCVSDYVAPADALVIALKFRAHLELAGAIASVLAARAATSRLPLPDLVVPIPLSSARLASRGYNQAWEIARVFARRIGRPADAHCLGRVRDTRAQSSLRGAERWRNMRRAFVVSRPDRVRGAHVGLVDDVMTSGATLEAAASVLKRAGATRDRVRRFANADAVKPPRNTETP